MKYYIYNIVPKDYCSVEYDLKNLVWLCSFHFGK
nr:MAG TPA: hypothetical protein [Caudoviricetes sp.]